MLYRSSKAILCGLMMFSASTQAAILTYFDETNFLNAPFGYTYNIEDFEGLAPGDLIPDSSTVGGITYQYSITDGQVFYDLIVDNYAGTTSGTNYLGVDDGVNYAFLGGDSVTFSFSSDIIGFGFYVISGDELFADDVTLTVGLESVGLDVSNPVDVGDGDAFFIGFMFDDIADAFNSVTMDSFIANYLFNIDDIYFLTAPSGPPNNPVPSPALGLLMLTAVLWSARKRSK